MGILSGPRAAACALVATTLLAGTGAAVNAGPPPAGSGAPTTVAAAAPARLSIKTVSVSTTQVRDPTGRVRGPAAAALPDGRVLLGGGRDGRWLYVANPERRTVTRIGSIIPASRRLNDARFAPTDIEVMRVTPTSMRLLISYPEYVPSRRCVRVAVNRVELSGRTTLRIARNSAVLRSSPCVATNGPQQAAGRLVRLGNRTALLAIGDLSSPLIANRARRGQLGTIQRISLDHPPVRVSQGHRNGQGLVRDALGRIWETEHGPRGGDELNLIRTGRDYGWPFVTLGQPYGPHDYVQPLRTGTHVGYTAPRTAWVPSVATSELVQVPARWAGWSSSVGPDLLMGTLKDQSLWRIRVGADARVIARERISVGHRIRDLEVRRNGSVVATTDDGRLLIITA